MSNSKARNLSILQKNGILVPDFYIISAKDIVDLSDKKNHTKLLRRFRNWLKHNNYDSAAIRSSAAGEDGDLKSFAGQYASVMEVSTDDDFIKAIKKVSSTKPDKSYSTTNHEINIIVQRYIKPELAGVIFTINPINGSGQMVINAVNGHGSEVVEGKEAGTIYLDRFKDEIHSQNKHINISKKQILELKNVAKKIELIMQSPQDVEWAYAEEMLYILQTRPITRISHTQVWDSSNIGESFPGIVSPLTFSISRRGYELVYKSQAYEAGLNWYQIEGNHRTFNSMVGIFAGRMYYNLANWYSFIGLFPNNSNNQRYLDEQLQTQGEAMYLPKASHSTKYKFRFYCRVLRRAIFFENERRKYWKNLNDNYNNYEALPAGNDIFYKLKKYSYMEENIIPKMGRSADNDFFVMTYNGLLNSRLKKWLGNSSTYALDYIGKLDDVISAKQALLLFSIAKFIKKDKKASSLLEKSKYKDLDKYLLSSPLAADLNYYRDNFLHRFAEDQKIEAINPLLPLSGFYSLIKAYTKLDSKKVEKRYERAAEIENDKSLKNKEQLKMIQKMIYGLLLSRLKHHLRIREHNRLLRGKAYAYLRELFIEIGDCLYDLNIIEKSKDIYFLEIEEIFRFVNGTSYDDEIKELISKRKKTYRKYEKINVPSKFITTGITNSLPLEFSDFINRPKKITKILKGTISSQGVVEGKVLVLDKPIIPKEPFDVLVVSHTDPGWTPLIALAKGLIIEHGGVLSHAAIITRELGIPSIIGVEKATQKLSSGMRVRINPAKSAVEII